MMLGVNKPIHPALTLYKRLFEQVAAGEDVATNTATNPTVFVEASIFHARLLAAGIDRPEGFVEFADWCDEIGLPEFAHKLTLAYHRGHGTTPTPMERGAWRLRCHLKRNGL